ncbi:MAG TPA: hypothetical protein VGO55_18590 [Allosphingosinicella sp.]|jgi:hypothetical protein|nr:hypothetical protein [Allosphingosinicella sp.]
MKRPSRRPSAAHDAEPEASTEPSRGDPLANPLWGNQPTPDFTPIPVRYRKDGWTPERQYLYVAALARTGHAGKAARAVGMTEQSAAKLRRRPDAASFNAACAAAFLGARRRWAQARLAAKGGLGAGRFGIYSPLGSRTL